MVVRDPKPARRRARLQLQTLSRGVAILDALANAPEGLRVTDIAQQLRLSMNTAGRLLFTLQASGYASRSHAGRYAIGPAMVSATIRRLNSIQLVAAARPYLEQLRRITKETAFIVSIVGNSLVIVDSVEGTYDLRVVLPPGAIYALFPATTAYALTIDLPEQAVVELSRASGDPRRLVNEAEILRARHEIKMRGYLIRHAALASEGTCTIATAIRHHGKVVASLGIAGPSHRWTGETIKPHLKAILNSTAQISRALNSG